MGARTVLGGFEQMVLLALARRPSGGYGAALHAEIRDATGSDVSIPAIYVTLKRMERKGLVASSVESGVGDTARPKRVYQLLPAGREALLKARALLDQMWTGSGLPLTGEYDR